MTRLINGLSKVKMSAPFHSRRRFIKTGLAEMALLIVATIGFTPITNAGSTYMKNSKTIVDALVEALRSIGSPVCLAAALKLEADQSNRDNIYFHLRHAALTASDALIIAEALKSLPRESHSSLVSMSLSYNDAIGDTGAIAMAQSLPPTLHELGLVNCGIGDAGGEALLRWAKNATGLRILCIEENNISEGIKLQLVDLMHRNAALLVVV